MQRSCDLFGFRSCFLPDSRFAILNPTTSLELQYFAPQATAQADSKSSSQALFLVRSMLDSRLIILSTEVSCCPRLLNLCFTSADAGCYHSVRPRRLCFRAQRPRFRPQVDYGCSSPTLNYNLSPPYEFPVRLKAERSMLPISSYRRTQAALSAASVPSTTKCWRSRRAARRSR